MSPELAATLAEHRAITGAILDQITDDILASWVRTWDAVERELLDLAIVDTPEARIQLERVRKMAAQQITDTAQRNGVLLTDNARVMIERALIEQPELVAAITNHSITTLRHPGEEIARIVRRTTEQITVRTYHLAEDATVAMRRALQVGISAGASPGHTAEHMLRLTEAVFNGGLARAMVIARTELIDAHRAAAEASHAANADLLTGWMWYAQLGPRTCPSCVYQHGTTHPLSQPGPLDHHQGRCARIPLVRGYTLDVETGVDWFHRQTEATKRKVLGPMRYEAWQEGRFPTESWSVKRETKGWRDAYHVGKPTD